MRRVVETASLHSREVVHHNLLVTVLPPLLVPYQTQARWGDNLAIPVWRMSGRLAEPVSLRFRQVGRDN